MALKAVVVSSGKSARVVIDGVERVDVLGDNGQVAIELDEILRDVSETVRSSITTESELLVELTGSITLKGDASVKWLVFNVGGSGERHSSLKVSLKTILRPKGST